MQLRLRFCEFCSRRRRKKRGFQDVFYCLKRTLKTIFHASLEIHCVDADLPIKSLHNFLNYPMGKATKIEEIFTVYLTLKVHIFWEGHKIVWNLQLTFDWHYIHRTKVRWRFLKILWPSQNIWTLLSTWQVGKGQ